MLVHPSVCLRLSQLTSQRSVDTTERTELGFGVDVPFDVYCVLTEFGYLGK